MQFGVEERVMWLICVFGPGWGRSRRYWKKWENRSVVMVRVSSEL